MAYKNIKNIIINTSCNLFSEKGYDNVSINEICTACSITKPTFYYHFKAKEDILFAQFNLSMDNCTNTISVLPVDKDGIGMLLDIFDCIFDEFACLGYDFIQNIIIGSVKNIERALYLPDEIQKKIISYIKKGQKDGSITNTNNADFLYNSCYHTFMGYVLFWCEHNGLASEFHPLSGVLCSILSHQNFPESVEE